MLKKYRKIYHKNPQICHFNNEGAFRDCEVELQQRVNLFFWKTIKTELIFIKESVRVNGRLVKIERKKK